MCSFVISVPAHITVCSGTRYSQQQQQQQYPCHRTKMAHCQHFYQKASCASHTNFRPCRQVVLQPAPPVSLSCSLLQQSRHARVVAAVAAASGSRQPQQQQQSSRPQPGQQKQKQQQAVSQGQAEKPDWDAEDELEEGDYDEYVDDDEEDEGEEEWDDDEDEDEDEEWEDEEEEEDEVAAVATAKQIPQNATTVAFTQVCAATCHNSHIVEVAASVVTPGACMNMYACMHELATDHVCS